MKNENVFSLEKTITYEKCKHDDPASPSVHRVRVADALGVGPLEHPADVDLRRQVHRRATQLVQLVCNKSISQALVV